jgi:hypothetical protein
LLSRVIGYDIGVAVARHFPMARSASDHSGSSFYCWDCWQVCLVHLSSSAFLSQFLPFKC